jgi:hypothetical protein
MIGVTGFRPERPRRGEAAAAVLELVILVVLLVFLGIAAGKLFLLLGRLGIPAWKGLPLGLAYLAAAAFAARRVSIRARSLQRGSRHDAD